MPVELGSAYGKVVIDSSGVTRGVGDAQRQVTSLESTFKGMAQGLARGSLILAGVGATVKKVLDFGEVGAGFERLETSGTELARQLGGNMDEIVRKVRAASLNTVSDVSIIQSANRAMMFQLGADADKLAELMEVAAFRGRAMGLSTQQAFDDIVRGVGRMSPLILDNLGIIIDAETRYDEWSAKMGVSKDAIDAVTKRQILLSAVLEEGNRMIDEAGGLAVDSATAVEQMDAAIANAKITIAQGLAPALTSAATGLTYLIKLIFELDDMLAENDRMLTQTSSSYEEYLRKRVEALYIAGKISKAERDATLRMMEDKEAVEAATEEYGDLSREMIINLVATGKMTEEEGELLIARLADIGALEEQVDQIGVLTEAQWKGARATAWLRTEEEEFKRMMEDEATPAVKKHKEALEDLQQAYDDLQTLIAGPVGEEMERFEEQQGELVERMAEVRREMEEAGAAGDTERFAELKKEYDDLAQKYRENADEHEEATKRIVYDLLLQRLAMLKLPVDVQTRLLTEVGKQMGLIDEETANMLSGIDQAIADFLATGNIYEFTQALLDVGSGAEEATTTADAAFSGLATSPGTLAMEAEFTEIAGRVDRIKSGLAELDGLEAYARLTLDVSGSGGGGVHGGVTANLYLQGGGSFTVPPGYSEPSNPFMVATESGEEVTVTPAGMTPGGGITLSIGDIHVYGNADPEQVHAAVFDAGNSILAEARSRGLR